MDSEQDKPTSQQHASTPGAALAAAREAMGLSVEQVADQLKLAPRQVQAIEQGDFDALPNRAVTRGFIRAYAKAMRLDPAPLVAMVEVEGAVGHADATVRPTRVQASFQESRFPSLNERNNGKPLGAIVAGVAVLALGGVAAAWQMGYLAPLTLATRAGVGAPASVPEPVVVTHPNAPAAEAPLQSPSVPLISVPPQPGSNNATVAGAGLPGAPAGGVAPAANTAPAAAAGTVPAAPGNPAGAAGAAAVGAPAAGAPATGSGPAAQVAPANRPAPGTGTAATPPAGAIQAPAAGTAPANAAPAAPGLIPAKPATGAAQPNQPAGSARPAAAGVPAAATGATGAAAPATPPATAMAAAGQGPAVGAAGGKLVLTVKEDSWVEIRRPGQAALIARLVRAGSTETFNVREKDLLIVGKPGAVSASLAGAQLDLPQVPGGTISRVPIK